MPYYDFGNNVNKQKVDKLIESFKTHEGYMKKLYFDEWKLNNNIQKNKAIPNQQHKKRHNQPKTKTR